MLFITLGCQDELETVPEENNVTSVNSPTGIVSMRKLKGKDALDKAMLLQTKLSLSSSFDMNYRTDSNNGTIDYNNILEVIDNSGIANYTFKIINHPDDSDIVFHNLVLTIDGNEQKVTLLKYEYENNATEIQNFEGKITAKNFLTEEQCDEIVYNGNFNPSEGSGANAGATYPVIPGGDSGTTGPGSAGTGTVGGSGFLTVSNEPASISFQCNSCSVSANSWTEFSTHTDSAGNIYPFTIVLNMGRLADLSPNLDPCGGNGTVGIISKEDEMINDIEECLGIESEWLSNEATFEQISQISQYLDQNECSEEAQAFAEAVLDAGPDAKVDYVNEVILDSTFLANEKIKCTYDKISQNVTIKNLLENFTGQDNANILIFKVQEDVFCNNIQVEACTRSTLGANNTITTTFDEGYILSNQTPTLFIAQTIIHEAIHANMYLALYNHEQGNLINLPAIDNFPAIYEQYRLLKGWQHEFMAAHYISLIAQTLQDIHPLLNDQTFIVELNNDYPDLSLAQFYTSIAYLGLNGTTAQSTYLSDPNNNANYNISYYAAQANSTKTPNCN